MKSEFLPYIIKRQFSSLQKNLPKVNTSSAKRLKPKLFDYIQVDESTELLDNSSIQRNNSDDLLSCYGFLQAEGFCFRTNNISIFGEANRVISNVHSIYIIILLLNIIYKKEHKQNFASLSTRKNYFFNRKIKSSNILLYLEFIDEKK